MTPTSTFNIHRHVHFNNHHTRSFDSKLNQKYSEFQIVLFNQFIFLQNPDYGMHYQLLTYPFPSLLSNANCILFIEPNLGNIFRF